MCNVTKIQQRQNYGSAVSYAKIHELCEIVKIWQHLYLSTPIFKERKFWNLRTLAYNSVTFYSKILVQNQSSNLGFLGVGLLHSSLYMLAMTTELRNWRSESELRVFSQRVLSLRQYHEGSREDPVNICWSVFSFFSILCLFSPSTCSLLLLPLPLVPCVCPLASGTWLVEEQKTATKSSVLQREAEVLCV